MRKSSSALLSGFLLICAIAGRAAVAYAAQPHSHVYNAYRMLNRAHYVLTVVSTPHGVHRQAARQQVGLAIEQLKLGVAAVHQTLPQLQEAGTPYTAPSEVHHHAWVQDALKQCQNAKAELQAAQSDLGGHRANAIQHIDSAIAQLQHAIDE
jgi:hypothetical protein